MISIVKQVEKGKENKMVNTETRDLKKEKIANAYTIQMHLVHAAEECNELSQACLKYLRALENDTPVCERDAYEKVMEEIADVHNVVDVLTVALDKEVQYRDVPRYIDAVAIRKTERWLKRVNERSTVGHMETMQY
ncbi:MAG: hypothetical protein MJ168_07990 [Clostridia bacterium]|nr:hypothetical protein [Clostridia bacterium]